MPHEFDSAVARFGSQHADLPRAERAALSDGSNFAVEGAFVDGYRSTASAALVAIQQIYAARGVRAEDVARLTGILHSEQTYRNDVAAVLAAAGRAMLPALREALGHPRAVVRMRAVGTLAKLGCGREVVGLADDPDPNVRRAVVACGQGKDRAWLAAMGAQLEKEPLAQLRVEMVQRLARLRTNPSMKIVLQARTDPDGDVRTAAAESLQALRDGRSVKLATLARLAHEWLLMEYEAGICAELLRYAPLLPHEPRALPTLIALLDDAVLGPLAARCLARADEKQMPVAASALAAQAGRAEYSVQIAVFEAMASLRDGRAVGLFEERVPGWPVVQSKIGVLKETLAELKRTGREIAAPGRWPTGPRPLVLDAGVRGFAPPSEADRAAYLRLTSGTREERYEATKFRPRTDRMRWWAGALRERLREEESASIRETILGVLGRLDATEAAAARILALDDVSPRVRSHAASDLTFTGGEAASRAILARLRVETDETVRRCLLDKSNLLVHAPEQADVILAFLEDPDPGVRARVAVVLRALGRAAVPHLERLSCDADEEVRTSAAKVLEWLP